MLSLKQGWAQMPGCWTFQLVLTAEAPVPAAVTRCWMLGCTARGALPCRSSGKHSSCTVTYRHIFTGALPTGGGLVHNLRQNLLPQSILFPSTVVTREVGCGRQFLLYLFFSFFYCEMGKMVTCFHPPSQVLGNLMMKRCTSDQGDYFFKYNLHTPVV